MTHTFKYMKDGKFVAMYVPGAVKEWLSHDRDMGMSYDRVNIGPADSADVILAPKVVSRPIPALPDDMYQGTIVDSQVAQPTAELMGQEWNGGYGTPWAGGPLALANIPQPLGSMLFCIGRGVAVSVGIGGEPDLFSQVLVNYHRRDVALKIHTGIGSARGGASRDSSGGAAVVPGNRPVPQPALPMPAPSLPVLPGGQGPTMQIPGIGPVQIPAEEHGSGMHQHPGSSFLDRWKEDFGSVWDSFSDFPAWVF